MNKFLVSLVFILGFSLANAAGHGVHGGSTKSDSVHKAKVGLSFNGGIF